MRKADAVSIGIDLRQNLAEHQYQKRGNDNLKQKSNGNDFEKHVVNVGEQYITNGTEQKNDPNIYGIVSYQNSGQ